MNFERITAENLALALKVAAEIFPYEVKNGKLSFEDDAYRASIREAKPDFAYNLVQCWGNPNTGRASVVGITGWYREADGTMWLDWFGVRPGFRGFGLGEIILRMTAKSVSGLGVKEMFLYTGQRQEEHHAHRLYERLGFVKTTEGHVKGESVFFFRGPVPIKDETEGEQVMWCMKKNGKLYPQTLATTQHDCWSFDLVSGIEGEAWKIKYWKRWDASIASAKRLGWSFVPVKVVEVKK